MTREELLQAKVIERQLSQLEERLFAISSAEKISIMECDLVLTNEDHPSAIGSAFRDIRRMLVSLTRMEIAMKNDELRRLGVEVEP